MKTFTVILIALAMLGWFYAAAALFLARWHLPSFFSYLPFANEAEIPPKARCWRNRAYAGAAIFIVGCTLAVLVQRFL
jgi:hypothetical protein